MKKLLILLIPFLFLVGCGASKEELLYQKQKDCIGYRNDYMQYVMNKYGFISEKDYDGESTKNILRSFNMFYSEPFDKCIATYAYDLHQQTKNGPDVVTRTFYIDDAFEGEFLRYDTCYFYSEEGCRDYYESYFNRSEYYKTGKGEPRNKKEQ